MKRIIIGLVLVGQLMAVDAGQQLGATPDVEDALAQQRAQRPHLVGSKSSDAQGDKHIRRRRGMACGP